MPRVSDKKRLLDWYFTTLKNLDEDEDAFDELYVITLCCLSFALLKRLYTKFVRPSPTYLRSFHTLMYS